MTGAADIRRASTAGALGTSLALLRPFRRQVLLLLAPMSLGLVWVALNPRVYVPLIDNALVKRDARQVAILTLILLALAILDFAGSLAARYLAARLGARMARALREDLFAHVQRLPLTYFARHQTGDVLSRFTADLATVENAFIQTLPRACLLTLQIVVCVTLLFAEEWHLALFSALLLPVVFAAPRTLGPRASEAAYRRQEDLARLTGVVHENVAAQRVVRAFSLQDVALARVREHAGRVMQRSLRLALLSEVLGAVTGFSARLFQVALIGVAAELIVHGAATTGRLYAFYLYLTYAVEAVQALVALVQPLQQATGAMERVREVLAEPARHEDDITLPPLPRLTREIRLREVSFSYPDAAPVLKGIGLTIPAGSSVAIVGLSGSGKTTLCNLLLRFYDPDRGVVSIDDHDLRTVSHRSLLAQIGMVFQETMLFDTTIRENIRVGCLDAADAEIEEAARAAELHDFVLSLPRGYDTPIGEGGGQLSGGQRQRLALARALVRRPAILLLDEVTSALDPQTEAAITATLRRLAGRCTLIQVTHRLAVAAKADIIYVLDGGSLVEHGTHAALLHAGGLYQQLWQHAEATNGQPARPH